MTSTRFSALKRALALRPAAIDRTRCPMTATDLGCIVRICAAEIPPTCTTMWHASYCRPSQIYLKKIVDRPVSSVEESAGTYISYFSSMIMSCFVFLSACMTFVLMTYHVMVDRDKTCPDSGLPKAFVHALSLLPDAQSCLKESDELCAEILPRDITRTALSNDRQMSFVEAVAARRIPQ